LEKYGKMGHFTMTHGKCCGVLIINWNLWSIKKNGFNHQTFGGFTVSPGMGFWWFLRCSIWLLNPEKNLWFGEYHHFLIWVWINTH